MGCRNERQILYGRLIVPTPAYSVVANDQVGEGTHLRKLYNFCLSMNWLPWPVTPKRHWPEIKFKPKRVIPLEEHRRIVERERWRARNCARPANSE